MKDSEVKNQLEEEIKEQILSYSNGATVWHITDRTGYVLCVIKDRDDTEIYSSSVREEVELLTFYESMFNVARVKTPETIGEGAYPTFCTS